MNVTGDLERRATIELRATGNRLEGHAAVFDSPSHDLGGFVEIVRPGAFTRSLAEGADVLALFDHDTRAVLGRRSAGTLTLEEDARGLRFAIDVAQTTAGRDVLVSVARRDIAGASFAFIAREDRWTYSDNGPALRELLDVELLDVAVTPMPAYPDTDVARRALNALRQPVGRMLARRYLEAIGA